MWEEVKEFHKHQYEIQMELYKMKGVNKHTPSPLHTPTPTEKDDATTHFIGGFC